jgi:hypothetical protein
MSCLRRRSQGRGGFVQMEWQDVDRIPFTINDANERALQQLQTN